MEVEDQIRPGGGVERCGCDPLARGSVFVARVGAVHLRIVDRVAVFGDLKRVVVDDPDDQDRPRKLGGIQSWDDALDDANAVEFVTVAGRLHVERLPRGRTVYHGDGQSNRSPVSSLADLETA